MSQRIKHFIFALIPLLVLILALETGLRCIHYQRNSEHKFALAHGLKRLQGWVKKRRLAYVLEKERLATEDLPDGLWDALFGDDGRELRLQFESLYEQSFDKLAKAVQDINSRLVVLYIPMAGHMGRTSRGACRNLFERLSRKHEALWVDMTEIFAQYYQNDIYLLPENGHLSRFGNKVVSRELLKHISTTKHCSGANFDKRPSLLGDLKPNMSDIWNIRPSMPYRVVTNSQGLRMNYNLEFPKTRMRVLCLGDSMTFGPYLANHNCFPALLDKLMPEADVINAGIAGFTITDEVSLFLERARYAEPDITILQTLDNDIYGLFYFKLNQFDRKRRTYRPTELEKELIEKLKGKHSS